jgi:hypothetical protein
MPEPRRLRFTLADAMILVAATTPGLILIRIAVGFGLFTFPPPQKNPPGREFLENLSLGGSCVLLSLSLAVLILTARRARGELRHASEGPGFVACLVVLAASVLPLAYFAREVMESHGFIENITTPYSNMFARLADGAGLMIMGAWLALAMVGRWRPQPTWTDRLGCVVGACWVLLYISGELYFIVVLPLLEWWGD